MLRTSRSPVTWLAALGFLALHAPAQSVSEPGLPGYTPTLPPVSASKPFVLGAGTPYDGLTLFQPMFDTTARLIDNSGAVVKSWPGTHNPGLIVYLLPSGRRGKPSAGNAPVGTNWGSGMARTAGMPSFSA